MKFSNRLIELFEVLISVAFLGEMIHRGAFGMVRFAEAYDPAFGLDGLERPLKVAGVVRSATSV